MKIKNEKGFTMVEFIVAVVIIVILVFVAVPKFLDLSDMAKIAGCKENQAIIETAASVGFANNVIELDEKTYPEDVYTMVTLGLLESVPECPDDGIYTYYSNTGKVKCSKKEHSRE